MKKTLYILLLVCVGVVLGSLLAHFTASVPALSWLSFGLKFGLTSPLVLDLSFLVLTFGLTIDLNVAVVICLCLSLFIGLKAAHIK
ncbi:MAG: DUF4321 domain-containing protein [Firmicutes bacterium]|nr:DUF4321 domain-containing protein [Bacillota bacterium]